MGGTGGKGRELCEWDRNCILETGTIREGLKLLGGTETVWERQEL